MSRKIKELISIKAIRHLYYLPIIIFKIKNWYSFLLNYLGFKNEANTYKFRNGILIKTNENIDAATIAVIFIKKDYGIIKDNSTIIDIGTNIGIFSIYAASTSNNTKVYSYEPMPKTYNLLLENIKLNKLDNKILPFQLGVGSKKEKRRLFLAGGSPFHSLYSTMENTEFLDISVISLKDIFDNNHIGYCDILKSDCEGAEFEIFYNTPDEYFEKIKEIRLEYHNQKNEGDNIKRLIKFFENKGFSLTIFREDSQDAGNAWFKRI